MTTKSAIQDSKIHDYIVKTMAPEHPLLRELREETAKLSHSRMQIGPEQGRLMQVLAAAIGARRYLEIGVFTGYSSLAMALALPADGYVLACDVNEETTAVARRYWQSAGVAERIDLRIAPAIETLESVRAQNVEPFDVAFIDADKECVNDYYELALELVRPGGFVLVDNVLWDGAVADPSDQDPSTRALRLVAEQAGRDRRVDAALVPVCDGLLIALKR
ncbi:MAG TPA: class I SAM-dependent methyltransferase [Candidatus Cybelea sp.]|nr:class I SAM-dependent methyltransferase [Candidatus Cybelea sp.]